MSHYTVSYPTTGSLSATLTVTHLPLTAQAAASQPPASSKCHCTLDGRQLRVYKSKHDKSSLQTYDLSNADIRTATDNSSAFHLTIPTPPAKLTLVASSSSIAEQWVVNIQSISLNYVENEVIDLTDDDIVANELQAAHAEQQQYDQLHDVQYVLHNSCLYDQCTTQHLLQCAAECHTLDYILFYLDVQLYQLQCQHLLQQPAPTKSTELLNKCKQFARCIYDRYIATHTLPGQQQCDIDVKLADFELMTAVEHISACPSPPLTSMNAQNEAVRAAYRQQSKLHLFDRQVDFVLKPISSLLWPAWLASRYLQRSQLRIQPSSARNASQGTVIWRATEYWERAEDVLDSVPRDVQQEHLRTKLEGRHGALVTKPSHLEHMANDQPPSVTTIAADGQHQSSIGQNPFDHTGDVSDDEVVAANEAQPPPIPSHSPTGRGHRSHRPSINPFDEDDHSADAVVDVDALQTPVTSSAALSAPPVSFNPFALSDADEPVEGEADTADGRGMKLPVEPRHSLDDDDNMDAAPPVAHNPFMFESGDDDDSDGGEVSMPRSPQRRTDVVASFNKGLVHAVTAGDTTEAAINPFDADDTSVVANADETPSHASPENADDSGTLLESTESLLVAADVSTNGNAVNPFDDDDSGEAIGDNINGFAVASPTLPASALVEVNTVEVMHDDIHYDKLEDELKDQEPSAASSPIISSAADKPRKPAKSNYSEWKKIAKQRKAAQTSSRR